ncbi:MAG: 23S rRNA (pseudouridine(1915)-N(3))-methyltransferase RlmH [Deltaproteobacteria bacterium]|nr:23S rRNA (pseudouridine(1915)-N(3))-methyltransferase RlmH [Deltaproteobacteria bacterium]MCB9787256.1 23S rRNA (pseudouridine(1915)-N(3))-methyltransferase RlmH [Deltaproteobacteria bacterium]
MIFRLIHAGSAGSGALDEAARSYMGRLGRSVRVEELFVRSERLPDERPESVKRALAAEAERLLGAVGPRDRLVALSIGGSRWTSVQLAERYEAWLGSGARAVVFALGSAHGLAEEVEDAATERWSLGPLTLPHDLARVVLWEQLYRAATIARGEPYHK